MRAVYVYAGTRRPTETPARLSILVVSTLTAIVALVVFAIA